ncbi:MAG: hypothetical protein CJBNEKGG_01250 [Prosthecobacter sp.]|nr:hypothetical protein [Prosthecobacter sp.]
MKNIVAAFVGMAFCSCVSKTEISSNFYEQVDGRNHLSFENGLLIQKERVFKNDGLSFAVRSVPKPHSKKCPDLTFVRDRLLNASASNLTNLIKKDDLKLIRCISFYFESQAGNKNQLRLIVVEFFLDQGIGYLTLKKSQKALISAYWSVSTRDGRDESVAVPKSGIVPNIADKNKTIEIYHEASDPNKGLAGKIFNISVLSQKWSALHLSSGELIEAHLRIQPDYGAETHDLDNIYSVRSVFRDGNIHCAYYLPGGITESDFWVKPN